MIFGEKTLRSLTVWYLKEICVLCRITVLLRGVLNTKFTVEPVRLGGGGEAV